eukprot:gene1506-35467_t
MTESEAQQRLEKYSNLVDGVWVCKKPYPPCNGDGDAWYPPTGIAYCRNTQANGISTGPELCKDTSLTAIIAGSVSGSGVLTIIIIVFCCWRCRKKKRELAGIAELTNEGMEMADASLINAALPTPAAAYAAPPPAPVPAALPVAPVAAALPSPPAPVPLPTALPVAPVVPALPSTCKALHPYTATAENQLTVAQGDILTIVDAAGPWWKVKASSGAEGLLPSNYVEKVVVVEAVAVAAPAVPVPVALPAVPAALPTAALPTPPLPTPAPAALPTPPLPTPAPAALPTPPLPTPAPAALLTPPLPVPLPTAPPVVPALPSTCKALHPYTATAENQLTVAQGDILTIVDAAGPWWKVKAASGAEGLVPSNYVEKVDV